MTDREFLERIKRQLYQWARASQMHGWSTHQVDPMRLLAGEIDRHLCETEKPETPTEDARQ